MTTVRLRVALLLLAIGLALLAVREHRRREQRLERLEAVARELGVAAIEPGAVADLRRASGRTRSGLRLARLLMAVELERGLRPDAEGLGDETIGLARLAAARELALEAVAEQPASWQGWMVLGGSRFLELSRQRDPRLATERRLWLEPLETARRLAPAQPEPTRLLAAAYLSLWSGLDDRQRATARQVVADALADPISFELLIEVWLRLAPSRRAAFEPVPPIPGRWRTVMAAYADSRDWERWCQARDRWLETLAATTRERIQAPDPDPKTRYPGRAARRILAPLAPLPPGPGFAPFVAEAFERLAEDELIEAHPRAFAAWFHWAVEQCAIATCPLDAATMVRLGRAAGADSPVQQARLALALGDRQRADKLVARHSAAGPEAAWAPYRELESLLAGQPTAAARPGGEWPAAGWVRRGLAYRFGPIATPAASGFEIAIGEVEGQATALIARWDGAEAGCHPVASGGRISVNLPIEAGRHLVDLIGEDAGLRFAPGQLRLRPGSPIERRPR